MNPDDLLPTDVLVVIEGVFRGNVGCFYDRMGERAVGIQLPYGVIRVPLSHVRLADHDERARYEKALREATSGKDRR